MLSLPENWDYTTKGLARICKDGVDSICAGVRELEEQGYVVRERVRNPNGQLGAIEYTILEQPRPPEREKPERENPVQVNPVLDSPVLGKPKQENPAQLNTKESSKQKSKTDLSSTEISNPIQSNPPTPTGARMGTDGMGAREIYREIILENIGYAYLIQDSHIDREQLDEIAELIVDTVCSARKTIRIAGDDYPAEVVKSRFMKLDSSHVQYVMDCMRENTPMSAISRNTCWRPCITRRAQSAITILPWCSTICTENQGPRKVARLCGERRSKGTDGVFGDRRKRSIADFATTRKGGAAKCRKK